MNTHMTEIRYLLGEALSARPI